MWLRSNPVSYTHLDVYKRQNKNKTIIIVTERLTKIKSVVVQNASTLIDNQLNLRSREKSMWNHCKGFSSAL